MFYKHAFLEAESQTLVTKAKSFAFTVQVNLRTITQVLTAGTHMLPPGPFVHNLCSSRYGATLKPIPTPKGTIQYLTTQNVRILIKGNTNYYYKQQKLGW